MRQATAQEIRQQLLFAWGIASVLCVLSAGLGMAIAGTASLALCFMTGRRLRKKGLLPEINEED